MKGAFPADNLMKQSCQLGWKECQASKKRTRKLLEQIIHIAKGLITKMKEEEKDGEKFFGPKGLIFCFTFFSLFYSLTALAAMFYEK